MSHWQQSDALTSCEDDLNLRRDVDLLYRRFGYIDININVLLKIVRVNSAGGLHIPAYVADPEHFHCESCSMAKAQQHLPAPVLRQPHKLDSVNKELYFKVV